jgi:hypothetical protein
LTLSVQHCSLEALREALRRWVNVTRGGKRRRSGLGPGK